MQQILPRISLHKCCHIHPLSWLWIECCLICCRWWMILCMKKWLNMLERTKCWYLYIQGKKQARRLGPSEICALKETLWVIFWGKTQRAQKFWGMVLRICSICWVGVQLGKGLKPVTQSCSTLFDQEILQLLFRNCEQCNIAWWQLK